MTTNTSVLHTSITLADVENLECSFAKFGGHDEDACPIWEIPQWLIELKEYCVEKAAIEKDMLHE